MAAWACGLHGPGLRPQRQEICWHRPHTRCGRPGVDTSPPPTPASEEAGGSEPGPGGRGERLEGQIRFTGGHPPRERAWTFLACEHRAVCLISLQTVPHASLRGHPPSEMNRESLPACFVLLCLLSRGLGPPGSVLLPLRTVGGGIWFSDSLA